MKVLAHDLPWPMAPKYSSEQNFLWCDWKRLCSGQRETLKVAQKGLAEVCSRSLSLSLTLSLSRLHIPHKLLECSFFGLLSRCKWFQWVSSEEFKLRWEGSSISLWEVRLCERGMGLHSWMWNFSNCSSFSFRVGQYVSDALLTRSLWIFAVLG